MRQLEFLVSLAAVLVAASAHAGPPSLAGRHDDSHMARMLERHADEIGLDEATLARIRAVVAANRGAGERIQRDLHAAHESLREMLSADRPDEAAVMRQADAIGVLETAALKHKLRTLLAVRPLLSDAQLAKLRDLREGRFAAVRAACAADVAAHCADVPPGKPLFRCLRGVRAELSAPCRDALRDLRGPGSK